MLPELKTILEHQCFFKFIMGASYRNLKAIKNLSKIFTLANAHVIDVGANPDVVKFAKEGINAGCNEKSKFPLLMISIGLNNDVHFMQIRQNTPKCVLCGKCMKICPNNVFIIQGKKLKIYNNNCVGCGKCVHICESKSLKLVPIKTSITDIRDCIKAGADAVEIHCGGGEIDVIKNMWKKLCIYDSFKAVSFSIGAHGLTTDQIISLIDRIKKFVLWPVIWQIDGSPISGRAGEESTLPTLFLAKEIRKVYPDIFLQLSGGVNNLTYTLAKQENIIINGIGMGSFARSYLNMDYLGNMDFKTLLNAIKMAAELFPSPCIPSNSKP